MGLDPEDGAKYLMKVIQDPGGDFSTVAQGAFSQQSLGFPVGTIWTGSIVNTPGKGYEVFTIGMVNNSTGFPAPTPEVWGVHATLKAIDCDTIQFDYDFFGAYRWESKKTPFTSPPDYLVVPPPFSETYKRMPLSCTACVKP